ncbi:hypothetical protein AGMMS49936_11570 [Endomicrobiia bacterium]|nr:hypothetical protein AGMMS49936_11570 [Endomicrobiia bacterium]
MSSCPKNLVTFRFRLEDELELELLGLELLELEDELGLLELELLELEDELELELLGLDESESLSTIHLSKPLQEPSFLNFKLRARVVLHSSQSILFA